MPVTTRLLKGTNNHWILNSANDNWTYGTNDDWILRRANNNGL